MMDPVIHRRAARAAILHTTPCNKIIKQKHTMQYCNTVTTGEPINSGWILDDVKERGIKHWKSGPAGPLTTFFTKIAWNAVSPKGYSALFKEGNPSKMCPQPKEKWPQRKNKSPMSSRLTGHAPIVWWYDWVIWRKVEWFWPDTCIMEMIVVGTISSFHDRCCF